MALVASMQDDGDMQEEEKVPAPPKWSRTRVAKSRKPESSPLQ